MVIFLDTNIILDVLLQREPFFKSSETIWSMVENKTIKGFISANSITDIFYIVNKHLGNEYAYEVLESLIKVFNIARITVADDIKKALEYKLKDFEDSLQVVCAKNIKAKYLITRNSEDFKSITDINVISPDDFLKDMA